VGVEPFRSFWDRAYADGDHLEHWQAPGVPAELAAAVADGLVPAGAPVADLGCGSGAEAVWLARQGYAVIGVDGSREALVLARRRAAEAGVEVDWRWASVLDLPLPDAGLGFAFDRGCFHGIEPEDRPLYAAEVARVLAPGGRLLLTGAAEEDEEAALWAVDAAEVDRWFAACFVCGEPRPVVLAAPAGDLAANAVLLTRRG
jgi:SAM-dependent methyltransferase